MADFYIDFENVQSSGLEEVELLTEDDTVFILYSNHADSIKIDTAKKLFSSKAKVEIIKAVSGTPNALDFQLVALLFMQIKKETEAYIVSKDTGFNAAIHIGQEMGYEKIARINSLKDYFLPDSEEHYTENQDSGNRDAGDPNSGKRDVGDQNSGNYDTGVQDSVTHDFQNHSEIPRKLGDQIAACPDVPKGKKQLVGQAVRKSRDKAEFYRFFIKAMGQQPGRELYLRLRTQFDSWKSLT